MRTLEQILKDGIKDTDWTYCKAEYAPHEGCKIGMPEEFTPDGTKRPDVKTLYIMTGKFRDGEITAYSEVMHLSDGKFYWYDNLWYDDEIVDREKVDIWFVEPIAWIAYKNVPEITYDLPIAPCKAEAVLTPTGGVTEGLTDAARGSEGARTAD